ncbi:phage baseplate assembly protein V [Brevibacillus panacihumi]|uniref:Phage baseplate assembly protein V n=1 Tax=Brevibacillus panacihumi TaxID=497735 RepID=A0A3M8C9H4_9BACL|nr:phage baseplate assembly protein V [Brevibacillus panacihumi]RNB72181.1 phage baseplate assembly protein V [Brevibacillus panacihumi]
MDITKNLIRVGRVSAVYPERCTARVVFDDRANLVSYELPTLGRGSLANKDYWLPDVDEQVWCLFLPNGNQQGVILGTTFNRADPPPDPPVQDKDKRYFRFGDGTYIQYDRNSHTMTIDIPRGTVVINGRLIVNDPGG